MRSTPLTVIANGRRDDRLLALALPALLTMSQLIIAILILGRRVDVFVKDVHQRQPGEALPTS